MCFYQIVVKREDWLTLLLLPSGFFRVLLESLFLRVVSLFNWKDSSRTNYWNKSSTITYAVKWVSASCKCFQYHRNEFSVLRRQTYFPRCTHEIHKSLQIAGGFTSSTGGTGTYRPARVCFGLAMFSLEIRLFKYLPLIFSQSMRYQDFSGTNLARSPFSFSPYIQTWKKFVRRTPEGVLCIIIYMSRALAPGPWPSCMASLL